MELQPCDPEHDTQASRGRPRVHHNREDTRVRRSSSAAAEGKRTLRMRAPVTSPLSPEPGRVAPMEEASWVAPVFGTVGFLEGRARPGPPQHLAHSGFGERMLGGLGSEGPSLEPRLLAGKPAVGSAEHGQVGLPAGPTCLQPGRPFPATSCRESKPGTGLEPQVVLGATGKGAGAPAHLLPPPTLLCWGAPRLLLPPLRPPLTHVPPERLAWRQMPGPPGRPQTPADPGTWPRRSRREWSC